MLKQARYTPTEYDAMFMFAMQRDNLSAASELRDHEKFFGKTVEVFKGRKVPHGTRGVVVYFKSTNYSGQPIVGWRTRIGLKDTEGNVFYTAIDNIRLCEEQSEADNAK